MRLAIGEWQNRVRAEYGSAALTAQVVHWMIQLGLPTPLVRTGLRIVGDELDHAALSHQCLVALGGSGEPAPVRHDTLAMPAGDGPFAGLVDSIARNFCLGETFAVPLFAAMRAQTTHPEAREALDRILKDEAVHRAFGWDVLDCLVAMDGAGVPPRIEAQLPGWLDWYAGAYGSADTTPDDEDLAAGLLTGTEYRRIHDETVEREIRPRFARRGIRA